MESELNKGEKRTQGTSERGPERTRGTDLGESEGREERGRERERQRECAEVGLLVIQERWGLVASSVRNEKGSVRTKRAGFVRDKRVGVIRRELTNSAVACPESQTGRKKRHEPTQDRVA